MSYSKIGNFLHSASAKFAMRGVCASAPHADAFVVTFHLDGGQLCPYESGRCAALSLSLFRYHAFRCSRKKHVKMRIPIDSLLFLSIK